MSDSCVVAWPGPVSWTSCPGPSSPGQELTLVFREEETPATEQTEETPHQTLQTMGNWG